MSSPVATGETSLHLAIVSALFSSQQNNELLFYVRHKADLRAEGEKCN